MTVETKDLTKAEIEFLSDKCEKLEEQLKIAKKGLTEIKIYGDGNRDCDIAAKYLKKIKELDK
jgi:hypothetical protein